MKTKLKVNFCKRQQTATVFMKDAHGNILILVHGALCGGPASADDIELATRHLKEMVKVTNEYREQHGYDHPALGPARVKRSASSAKKKPDLPRIVDPAIGKNFKGYDGKTYYCESLANNGYWMVEIGNPENRRNVTDRAIGSTFHEIAFGSTFHEIS